MPAFRCPVCAQELEEDQSGLRCSDGHRYDRAREGYVNVLRGGRLKGRDHGDSDDMIRARRAVFDAGIYAPLIDAVAAQVESAQPTAVLDVGCGEGSYLRAAVDLAACDGWGIDISKPAVRLAAQRRAARVTASGSALAGSIRFAVASAADLPFFDDSFDVAINVFSPREFDEMRRVLVPDGVAVVATPRPEHLREIKAALYDRPRPHDETVHPCPPFATEHVTIDIELQSSEMRRNLLMMTPFWWSSPPERVNRFVDSFGSVHLDVRIDCYRAGELREQPK